MSLLSASEAEREAHVRNVEDTLRRIVSHRGVVGYFVLDPNSGRILKSAGFGDSTKEVRRYAEKLRGLIDVAASTIRTIDWRDSMTFLRISCGVQEILVAPDLEKQYTLVVVQQIE